MGHPDVILRVHGHAGHRAEDLMIAERFRPQGIHVEPRRLRSASLGERVARNERHTREKEREAARAAAENMIPLHPAGLPLAPSPRALKGRQYRTFRTF